MYTKQTWNAGDVITEEKLNHIEDGISNAGGVLIVNENYNEDIGSTLDKTYKEIRNAYDSGTIVMIRRVESQCFVTGFVASKNGNGFIINAHIIGNTNVISYSTSFEDGYPELTIADDGGGGVM